MTNANQETRPLKVADEVGEAAANLAGNLGSNAAKLVGGVISDTAQVSRRWHELSLTVALTYLRTAADTVAGSVKKIQSEMDRKR